MGHNESMKDARHLQLQIRTVRSTVTETAESEHTDHTRRQQGWQEGRGGHPLRKTVPSHTQPPHDLTIITLGVCSRDMKTCPFTDWSMITTSLFTIVKN